MSNAATLDQVNAWMHRNRGYMTLALTAVYMLAVVALPGLAMAQDTDVIGDKATTALDWIKRGVYFVLVVAVLGAGVMAAFGRMSWTTVGQVLIGAIVAGVAAEVVSALYGQEGNN